jgi:hypothetical protein
VDEMVHYLFMPFWLCLRVPHPLLGREILFQMQTLVLKGPGQPLCIPLIETEVNPEVWSSHTKINRAINTVPACMHLKDDSTYPHQKTISLKT